MSTIKRGFVFYFDNCVTMEALPPDQRGWLLSALCAYADRVWRDETVTREEILDLYPQLSQEAQIAFQFLGQGILRDTQRWLHQQKVRSQRRQQGSAVPPQREPAAPQVDPQYTARLQKLVDSLRQERQAEEKGPANPARREEIAGNGKK